MAPASRKPAESVGKPLSLRKLVTCYQVFAAFPSQRAFHEKVAGVAGAGGFSAPHAVAVIEALFFTRGGVANRVAKTAA